MIVVRRAETDADLEAWIRVRRAVVPTESAGTVEEHRARASKERLLLLAELDGELAGSGLADRSDMAGRFFVAPRVLPSFRRLGVGTALLQELAGRAREEGIRRFSASVLAENSAVIEMVFKLGDAQVTARHDGVVDLVMDLPRTGLPHSLREALRAAAHGQLRLSRSWFSRSR